MRLTVLTRGWFWYRLLFLMARALIAPDEVEVLLALVDGGQSYARWQHWALWLLVRPMVAFGLALQWLRLRAYTVLFHLAIRSVRKSLGRAIGD